MLIMDVVGLVLVLSLFGLMYLMISPIILFFVHINRKLWRMMNRGERRQPTQYQEEDGEWIFVPRR